MFPLFSANNYCSIRLPDCVCHHKEWAKDFDGFATKLFSLVEMKEPPKPADRGIPKHWYSEIHRDVI